MALQVHVDINAPKAEVWKAICDIENAATNIDGIQKVEVLDRPAAGLVGFKWKETRKMFGKEATETMWITEAVENDYYQAHAESCGCHYVSTMRVSDEGSGSRLTMSHETQAQTVVAKVVAASMGILFKGAMKKLIQQDLNDIKNVVESKQ